MIFQSLLQAQVFGFMLFVGIVTGLVFEIIRFICALTRDNKYVRFVLDFVFCMIAFLLYLSGVYYCSYGEFRFFTIFALLLGLFLERLSLGYMFNKLLQLLYNLILKCYHKIIKRKKAHDPKQT